MERGITVFTSTYNRAYCIDKLYESLKRQTYKNFEWIVINDGSADDTDALFANWLNEQNDFEIIYMKVKNGGRMRAVNKGVRMASAPAFFIVDSDDYLPDDALEKIAQWFQEIADNDEFAGVSGLRKIPNVHMKKYNFDYIDATNFERKKYDLQDDMAECYKTELMRKFPSPEIGGENYISPTVVWSSIAAAGYKIRWHGEYVYHGGYNADGLSASGKYALYSKNPIGWGKVIQISVQGKQDEEYSEFQYYLYYLTLRERFSLGYMAEALNISERALGKIVKEKPKKVNEIRQWFKTNKIETIALYGVAGRAQWFLLLAADFGVSVSYAIDRRPNKIFLPCLGPEDSLPPVDAVIITNRFEYEDICASLKKRTTAPLFSLRRDICEKDFFYYTTEL